MGGQAFYACMAPMQYTLQTTSTNTATQKLRADKQKLCAETLTQMLKINQSAAASTPTCSGAKSCTVAAGGANGATNCVNRNQAAGANSPTTADVANAATTCRGSLAGAISFPLWKVGIGGNVNYGGQTDYFVPSGDCYANACFEDFAEVGTQSAFQGKTKLAALVKSPDMSSAPTAANPTTACGRANRACAAAPTGWTGAPAEFKICPITAVNGAGESTCLVHRLRRRLVVSLLPNCHCFLAKYILVFSSCH